MLCCILVVTMWAAVTRGQSYRYRRDDWDRVELTNGGLFFGQILRANETEVVIRLAAGGSLSFRTEMVARLERGPATAWYDDQIAWAYPLPPGVQDPLDDDEGQTHLELRLGAGSRRRAESITAESIDPDREVYYNEKHGFIVYPPRGLKSERLRVSTSDTVLTRYRHSPSATTFTVEIYDASEPLSHVKKKLTREFVRNQDAFRVRKDEAKRRGGREYWQVEIETGSGNRKQRRLQVLARNGRDIIVLTYDARADVWKRDEEELRRSAQSLEFVIRQ